MTFVVPDHIGAVEQLGAPFHAMKFEPGAAFGGHPHFPVGKECIDPMDPVDAVDKGVLPGEVDDLAGGCFLHKIAAQQHRIRG